MMTIKFDQTLLDRRFNEFTSKQLPFAMALTLTRSAQVLQRLEMAEIQHSFDRPTPFTVKSIFIKAATKAKLESYIFIRDEAHKGTPPVKYLAPGVYGGARRVKRFERALRYAGILGNREMVVPGPGVRLNRFGNLSPGTFTTILSVLKANPDPLQNETERSKARAKKPRAYFAGKPGGGRLPRGVWQRKGAKGRRIDAVLLFIPETQVDYERRFDFYGVIERELGRGLLKKEFKKALKEARRTGKKK